MRSASKRTRRIVKLTKLLSLLVSTLWLSIEPLIAQAPQFCAPVHKPVCGVVPANGIVTYKNSCEANKAGATIRHDGMCQGPGRKRSSHIIVATVYARV